VKTLQELRAARARAKSKGSNMVKAMLNSPMTPNRRVHLSSAAKKGAATRRAQGEVKYQTLLQLGAQGATLAEAMRATSLSENGVRVALRKRLGTGAWPPAHKGEN